MKSFGSELLTYFGLEPVKFKPNIQKLTVSVSKIHVFFFDELQNAKIMVSDLDENGQSTRIKSRAPCYLKRFFAGDLDENGDSQKMKSRTP